MSNKVLLGSLLPLMSNPTTLALVGIGAAGIIIANLLSDEDEDTDSNLNPKCNGFQQANKDSKTAYETVPNPLSQRPSAEDTTGTCTIETEENSSLEGGLGNEEIQYNSSDEIEKTLAKKEMIRLAMSELGKRSAAARARKKDTQSG